ncbi:MAG: tripartite tricarboxylate transporter TctB family protein [Pseudomonadota bacterium]
MVSSTASRQFTSAPNRGDARSSDLAFGFKSHVPEDRKFKIEDLMRFERGRGDLVFSWAMVAIALFFAAAFFAHTGWDDRKLPDDFGTYLMRQLGLIEGEGRMTRFGRILRQSWVAPALCLAVLLPATLLNLRLSWQVHRWRRRFGQPTAIGNELRQWLGALEFVIWFVAYTVLVPVLGYLLATVLLGTLLPYRMGYRTRRWIGICLVTSLAIVLVFRTGLQIKTPVNIWLYDFLPPAAESFMKTWF